MCIIPGTKHLYDPCEIPQVEGVMALCGRGKELDHGLRVDLERGGDDGGADGAKRGRVVAEVPVEDRAEDAPERVVRDLRGGIPEGDIGEGIRTEGLVSTREEICRRGLNELKENEEAIEFPFMLSGWNT